MDRNYLISIIIPCFNTGKYLEKMLLDFVKSNQKCEIIIIDDCSIDNTFELLQQFRLYENIQLHKNNSNRGVSFSRNLGLKLSRGKYVYFFDSDDFLDMEFYFKINNFILKHNYPDIIGFGFKLIKNNNIEVVYSYKKYDNTTFSSEKFLQLFLQKTIVLSICSCIIRRDIIINNGITFSQDIFYGEDYEFMIKCFLNSDKVFYTSEMLFFYYQNSFGAMNSDFNDKRLTVLDSIFNLESYFTESELKPHFMNFSIYLYYSLLKFMSLSNVSFSLIDKSDKYKKIDKYKPTFLFNKLSLKVLLLYYFKMINTKLFTLVIK